MLKSYEDQKMVGLILIIFGLLLLLAGVVVIKIQSRVNKAAVAAIVEAREMIESQVKSVNASMQMVGAEFSALKFQCINKLEDFNDLQIDHDNMIKAHELEIKRLKEKTRTPKNVGT